MRVALDILAVLLVAANMALGWRYGLINRGFAFAGLYGGLALATFAGNDLVGFLYGSGKANDLYADAWCFVSLVAGVVVGLEILAVIYRERARSVAALAFDRTAGLLVGGFIGFLEIGVICMVLVAVGSASETAHSLPPDRVDYKNAVHDGYVVSHIDGAEPFIKGIFAPAIKSDLPAHLAAEANK